MHENNLQEQDEIERIELRSTEVQEILSRPPKWIVRWGITIIFFIILLIFIGSWFFKYPDVISADIVLTTENPPSPVVAKVSGKIENLFVIDNDVVNKNQILGIIENPADYYAVSDLREWLSKFNSKLTGNEIVDVSKKFINLGEIQAYYTSFSKAMEEYNNELSLNYYGQKIELYHKERSKYNIYIQNLKAQNRILNEEYQLTKNQFNRDSLLHNQSLMSDSDFEQSKASLLSKQLNLEQSNVSITNVEIQIENLIQNITELKLQKEKRFSNLEVDISQSYENLNASIDSWEHNYMLKSPTEGKVTFNKFWNENQNVKSGETVMTIVPEVEGKIIGKVQLSFQGAGKVKPGQNVNIKFANYPYMEFGMVKGNVKSVSLAPDNNYYTAEIDLPNGLKTFYDVDLEFKQEMQGVAEIITEDIRLIERIIRPLRYIMNKNTNLGD